MNYYGCRLVQVRKGAAQHKAILAQIQTLIHPTYGHKVRAAGGLAYRRAKVG